MFLLVNIFGRPSLNKTVHKIVKLVTFSYF